VELHDMFVCESFHLLRVICLRADSCRLNS